VTLPNSLVTSSNPPELVAPLVANSLLHPFLTAGTQYWLAMSAVDNVAQDFWAFSGRPNIIGGGGQTDGPTAGRVNGGAWQVFQGDVQSALAFGRYDYCRTRAGTAVTVPGGTGRPGTFEA
jgi:hypothetical protein